MPKTLFLLILLLITACRQNDTPSPPEFKAFERNPILETGAPGSWDDQFIVAPCIVMNDKLFYMFYLGCNTTGITAVGLAISDDGFHFEKFAGNPVVSHDNTGFDAFGIGEVTVIRDDSIWVMYYNGRETAGYGPGPSFGRATAKSLTGPWQRSEMPVLETGRKGEWDAGFIISASVLRQEDGRWLMYYFAEDKPVYTGMATSNDGIRWNKYNDPATTQHPFAESDPVLMIGNKGDWDDNWVGVSTVFKNSNGFEMYYSGRTIYENIERIALGHATSRDGIQWEKYQGNPFYDVKKDPFLMSIGQDSTVIESPSVIFKGNTGFMYYDYGTVTGKIGLATARVH
jgi:predicted GH43/DUF377 family glycosyl hydrolase